MSWAYRTLLRPVLFLQDSERIHDRTLAVLAWAARSPAASRLLAACYCPEPLPVTAFGLNFPNPLGLAAGMDKHAAAVPIWESLGFGFSELGGVTWHAQPGNPMPRMFRSVPDQALINRMGFNNGGAQAMAGRLAEWRDQYAWRRNSSSAQGLIGDASPGRNVCLHPPIGINLGKSKITPLAEAAGDYANSLRALWPHADFFVVNVSSPNTPGLRRLQDRAALDEILGEIQKVNQQQAFKISPAVQPKPILVKVAPDLSFDALDEILELVGPRNIAGMVATNTMLARPVSKSPKFQKVYAEAGGLSGRPLADQSNEIIRHIWRQTKGTLPIIGVGGIFNAHDAWTKMAAGASLIQIYTGLVFEGPGVVKEIVRGLRTKMKSHGLSDLSQIVGLANKR